jgi:hypothetical protein
MVEQPLADLGEGLVLRRATAADTDALVEFYAEAFRRRDEPGPNVFFGEFVRDLLCTVQAPYGPGNFTLVEDTRTGAIASSLNLISQTWTYGGIEFPVGRIEPVGTLPDYRRRNLVRRQFEVAHAWSAERGEIVQVITGIPYFYRQFGYEYAIEMNGTREVPVTAVPRLKEGEAEPYRIRGAGEGDLAFIAGLTDAAVGRYLVTCRRGAEQWRHELGGRHWMSQNCRHLRIIESAVGQRVGYLAYSSNVWGKRLRAGACELVPGQSWAPVMPVVLRYLRAAGQEMLGKTPYADELGIIGLCFGEDHPAYAVLPSSAPCLEQHYPFLVRVPDLAAFLRHVAPVLERRLVGSPFAGHSGDLKLSFYRSGVRLAFEQGRLAAAEAWQPTDGDGGNAAFPDLTFTKLLFGYRSLTEIRYLFPDVWASEEAHALLGVLFPRQPSSVWPIG